MKPKYFFLLCLSFCIVHPSFNITQATVRFVSKTGSSTPPYTSWQTAADSIQKCINICSFGDTVYVANGVYKEQVIMIPGLSLIGAGMDSCVIDTRDLAITQNFKALIITGNCLVSGFNFLISYTSDKGIGISGSGFVDSSSITLNRFTTGYEGVYLGGRPMIYKNSFIDVSIGIEFFNSTGKAIKNIFYMTSNSQLAFTAAIYLQAFDNSYYPIIDSNYIVTYGVGIRKSIGTVPIISNNTIILKGRGSVGIDLDYSDSAFVYNNLIYAEKGVEGIYSLGLQHLFLTNNYISGNFHSDFQQYALSIDNNDIVKNNVISGTQRGVRAYATDSLVFQYNNIWNNEISYNGFTADSTNLSVDPMIVNDDTANGELDFHLQKNSPLIDAGNPNILDRDGSRSDIGLYGGPLGESYKYIDLAPRIPRNLTALVDSNYITLNWNKNTEADTAFYKVYRDTVSGFQIDSTKLIGSPADTFFVQLNPHNVTRFVYKVTCVDKQGNESEPSEEKVVIITGIDDYPYLVTDYQLYQNFPNPFNPSTTISYRLKERGYVKLYVYDIKGELVSVLVNKEQDAGFYQIDFSSSGIQHQGSGIQNLASGVYIYQLLIKSEKNIPVFSDIKKMVYLK